MAASETEIDLNDDEEPIEAETEEPSDSPDDIPEEIVVEENGQDSPDLGPSRQLHPQRVPSRGQIVNPEESSDNGKGPFIYYVEFVSFHRDLSWSLLCSVAQTN